MTLFRMQVINESSLLAFEENWLVLNEFIVFVVEKTDSQTIRCRLNLLANERTVSQKVKTSEF